MPSDSGTTTSLWEARNELVVAPELDADAQADVCVVGAGVAGLTTAYLLARAGQAVVVLDDGPIGGGETCRTTAHLSNVIDDRFHVLEEHLGPERTRAAQESHRAAIDRIEALVAAEGIECGFARVDGHLFLAPGQPRELLEREAAAAQRAGLDDLVRLERAPLAGFDTGPCLRFPRQAQLEPLRYLAGLVAALGRAGARLHTAHATEIEGGADAHVTTRAGRTVRAAAVVVATNSPVNDRFTIHTKQAPYRTYAIAARIPRASVPPGLYWDMADPYHYVRLAGTGANDEDVLIVGGEDHKTGQASAATERHAALESWMRARFPAAGAVEQRWSGQVLETNDGLAFIGRNPNDAENVYVATGDSGMGMTHGTLAGMILSDLILGRVSPWAELYDPARKSVRTAGEFLKENLNVAAQYVRDYVSPGEVASVDAIPRGAGAILRRGLTKVAVHRDAAGVLHELSAVCPHLGCIVHWNGVERTWDCPCHGSRFHALGHVVNGPANRGLSSQERSAAG